jgi:molybdate transport system substrate-binding protein
MARLSRQKVSGWTSVVAAMLTLLGSLAAPGTPAPPAGQAAAPDSQAAAPGRPREGSLLVFAASSLTDALEQIDGAFTAQSGIPVKASFAASSVLAKQIEAGAPAQVFLSADREWMDYLEERGRLQSGSRRELLGNELVLIAPADSALQLKIAPHFALLAALGSGRLATGDPDSVPAGLYARAALTRLGVWPQVADRLVRAENVRAALMYVARGEAPLGIVYRTDARAEERVRVVDVFPADTHPPITYPLALTAGAGADAARYAAFLTSAAAKDVFVSRGFVMLKPPRAP